MFQLTRDHVNEIKLIQIDKLLHEFMHKNDWKNTIGQIDLDEKFLYNDFWIMTDNISFSRYLSLEDFDNQSSRSKNADLVQSSFVNLHFLGCE